MKTEICSKKLNKSFNFVIYSVCTVCKKCRKSFIKPKRRNHLVLKLILYIINALYFKLF